MKPCSRCNHITAGRRRIRPDLCGPCVLPWTTGDPQKPIGWWTNDIPDFKIGQPAIKLAEEK